MVGLLPAASLDILTSRLLVCALRRFIQGEGKEEFKEVIAIAGDFDDHKLSENITLFNSQDKGQVVRVTLHGGPRYFDHDQSAVIDFVCDNGRTGLEGSKPVAAAATAAVEVQETTPSLKYIDYVADDKSDPKKQTLFLEWRTKLACAELAKGGGKEDKDSSSHWGFFTWIFFMYGCPLLARAWGSTDACCVWQILLGHGRLSDIWLVDQLQSIWRKRVQIHSSPISQHELISVQIDGISSRTATPSETFPIFCGTL